MLGNGRRGPPGGDYAPAPMSWQRTEGGPTAALDVGDTAPDFTLRWTFEESVTLSELLGRGPVVLLFYVFDFGDY